MSAKLLEAIDKLTADMAKIDSEQAALEADAEKNSNGRMNADQTTKYDALGARYTAMSTERDDMRSDFNKFNARQSRSQASVNTQRKTSPNWPLGQNSAGSQDTPGEGR